MMHDWFNVGLKHSWSNLEYVNFIFGMLYCADLLNIRGGGGGGGELSSGFHVTE